jgi:hypothetical protein
LVDAVQQEIEAEDLHRGYGVTSVIAKFR